MVDAATHEVQLNFLNDAYAGTPQTDRNVYVDDVTVTGQSTVYAAALMSAGPVNLTVPGTAPAIASGGSTSSGAVSAPPVTDTPSGSVTASAPAAGQDQIGIVLSEDAYQGDAQVSISIDGEIVEADYTLSALRSSGQTQTLAFNVADAATQRSPIELPE